MNLKKELLELCHAFLNDRLNRIEKTISGIETSLNSETKISAGDKNETGRAMLQLEREKAGVQLRELEEQKLVLSRIQYQNSSQRVALGSIVFTSKANYFIATSIGELISNNQVFYAISLQSPMGQLLKGKAMGDFLEFRNESIKIIKIL